MEGTILYFYTVQSSQREWTVDLLVAPLKKLEWMRLLDSVRYAAFYQEDEKRLTPVRGQRLIGSQNSSILFYKDHLR